jgi:hypothetical protein
VENMNSPEIKEYINKHKALFWYTPENEKENISEELLVETILNYATLEDIKDLFNIMGIDNVSKVFFGMEGRKKLNFFPEIYNYFTLVFERYVPKHP